MIDWRFTKAHTHIHTHSLTIAKRRILANWAGKSERDQEMCWHLAIMKNLLFKLVQIRIYFTFCQFIMYVCILGDICISHAHRVNLRSELTILLVNRRTSLGSCFYIYIYLVGIIGWAVKWVNARAFMRAAESET